MEYRGLGSAHCEISRIGFGCAPMSGFDYGAVDRAEVVDSVRMALDRGITLFDVSDIYGFGAAEELLSEALGENRQEVVIATKVGLRREGESRVIRDGSRGHIVQAVEGSLRRLRVDALTICQLHWRDPRV